MLFKIIKQMDWLTKSQGKVTITRKQKAELNIVSAAVVPRTCLTTLSRRVGRILFFFIYVRCLHLISFLSEIK